ncbi:hypothetical protein AAVH_26959 [Aphelenchoides avenae]|nr:hypothetical protein AAVH_26959 [Aphelenchus avenae]
MSDPIPTKKQKLNSAEMDKENSSSHESSRSSEGTFIGSGSALAAQSNNNSSDDELSTENELGSVEVTDFEEGELDECSAGGEEPGELTSDASTDGETLSTEPSCDPDESSSSSSTYEDEQENESSGSSSSSSSSSGHESEDDDDLEDRVQFSDLYYKRGACNLPGRR